MNRRGDLPGGWAYIVCSKSGTLYTGVTSDLRTRMRQHKMKRFAGFSAKYDCNRLAFFEKFEDISSAILREKQIKGWSRKRKLALIEAGNPEWKDLAADWEPEASYAAQGGGDSSQR